MAAKNSNGRVKSDDSVPNPEDEIGPGVMRSLAACFTGINTVVDVKSRGVKSVGVPTVATAVITIHAINRRRSRTAFVSRTIDVPERAIWAP